MSIITETLKKKYFELALQERYPSTPDITAHLDELEVMIKHELEKEKNGKS